MRGIAGVGKGISTWAVCECLLMATCHSVAHAQHPPPLTPTLMHEQRMYQVYSGPTIQVCLLTLTGFDTQP